MKTVLCALTLCLALVGCQGNTVGLACTGDSDCDKGQSCFLNGFPGGFCTKGCVDVGTTLNCPSRTICTTLRNDPRTAFCAPTCDGDDQCRGGEYACVTATPSGDVSACRI